MKVTAPADEEAEDLMMTAEPEHQVAVSPSAGNGGSPDQDELAGFGPLDPEQLAHLPPHKELEAVFDASPAPGDDTESQAAKRPRLEQAGAAQEPPMTPASSIGDGDDLRSFATAMETSLRQDGVQTFGDHGGGTQTEQRLQSRLGSAELRQRLMRSQLRKHHRMCGSKTFTEGGGITAGALQFGALNLDAVTRMQAELKQLTEDIHYANSVQDLYDDCVAEQAIEQREEEQRRLRGREVMILPGHAGAVHTSPQIRGYLSVDVRLTDGTVMVADQQLQKDLERILGQAGIKLRQGEPTFVHVGTTLPAEQSGGYDISTPAHVIFIHTAAFAEHDGVLTFEHYEGLQRDKARDNMLLHVVGRSDLGTDAWGQARPAQQYLELTNEQYQASGLLRGLVTALRGIAAPAPEEVDTVYLNKRGAAYRSSVRPATTSNTIGQQLGSGTMPSPITAATAPGTGGSSLWDGPALCLTGYNQFAPKPCPKHPPQQQRLCGECGTQPGSRAEAAAAAASAAAAAAASATPPTAQQPALSREEGAAEAASNDTGDSYDTSFDDGEAPQAAAAAASAAAAATGVMDCSAAAQSHLSSNPTVHLAMGPGAHEGVDQKSQDSAEISTTTERRHIGSLIQNPGSQMQQQQQNSVTAKSHVSAADSEFKNEFGVLQQRNSAEVNSDVQQQDPKSNFGIQQQKSASLAGSKSSKGTGQKSSTTNVDDGAGTPHQVKTSSFGPHPATDGSPTDGERIGRGRSPRNPIDLTVGSSPDVASSDGTTEHSSDGETGSEPDVAYSDGTTEHSSDGETGDDSDDDSESQSEDEFEPEPEGSATGSDGDAHAADPIAVVILQRS